MFCYQWEIFAMKYLFRSMPWEIHHGNEWWCVTFSGWIMFIIPKGPEVFRTEEPKLQRTEFFGHWWLHGHAFGQAKTWRYIKDIYRSSVRFFIFIFWGGVHVLRFMLIVELYPLYMIQLKVANSFEKSWYFPPKSARYHCWSKSSNAANAPCSRCWNRWAIGIPWKVFEKYGFIPKKWHFIDDKPLNKIDDIVVAFQVGNY